MLKLLVTLLSNGYATFVLGWITESMKSPWLLAIALILPFSLRANAMTGACYLDRAPGGCFERETTIEQQKKAQEEAAEAQHRQEQQAESDRLRAEENVKAADYSKNARWTRIEADDGAVYLADVGHITRYTNGSAEIVVYADQGDGNPANMSRLLFDCQGHFMNLEAMGSGTLYAAPRSVAGRVGALACGSK